MNGAIEINIDDYKNKTYTDQIILGIFNLKIRNDISISCLSENSETDSVI